MDIIAKSGDEQRMVWGWASVVERDGQPVIDHQGDIIPVSEIQKAAHRFVCEARVGKAMHDGEPVATMVESMVVTKEGLSAFLKSLGIEPPETPPMLGWWVGFRVDDDATWEKVKEGKLRAFSIGGRGKRVRLAATVDKAGGNFDESKHPRAEDGKWTAGDGGGGGDGDGDDTGSRAGKFLEALKGGKMFGGWTPFNEPKIRGDGSFTIEAEFKNGAKFGDMSKDELLHAWKPQGELGKQIASEFGIHLSLQSSKVVQEFKHGGTMALRFKPTRAGDGGKAAFA